jgi:dihydrofolate reductase / thymidylate synthase
MYPGMQNAVIMGRKTWESIPTKFRPLKDRMNIVLSKNLSFKGESTASMPGNVLVAESLEEALHAVNNCLTGIDQVFVIGGAMIYKEAIDSALCKRIYFTEVDVLNPAAKEEMDCFFPKVSAFQYRLTDRSEAVEEPGYRYRYTTFERIDVVEVPENSLPLPTTLGFLSQSNEEEKSSAAIPSNIEESQYLHIIQDILANGNIRGDRTGTGTISKFGVQMRFSLRNNRFPLLTTKKVFWRGVAEELIWFIHGSTNANELKDKGIHIWDGNGSREFLDKLGFKYRAEGDLGPVYGFQWRHFGAKVSLPTVSPTHLTYTIV